MMPIPVSPLPLPLPAGYLPMVDHGDAGLLAFVLLVALLVCVAALSVVGEWPVRGLRRRLRPPMRRGGRAWATDHG